MKRRSRMVVAMESVPTAAQAACRIKSRRVWRCGKSERFMERWKKAGSLLDRKMGRGDDELHDGSSAVTQLSSRGRRAVGECQQVIANDGSRCGWKLASHEARVQFINKSEQVNIMHPRQTTWTCVHPGTQIDHHITLTALEASKPILSEAVAVETAVNEIDLTHDARFRGELELRRNQPRL